MIKLIAAGVALLTIALYVQGNPIQIPAEACIEMFQTLRATDMMCFSVDQNPGDGVKAFDCAMRDGSVHRVLVGGSA